MKDPIRDIIEKGKTRNCSSSEEHEMFALFQQSDIEYKVKEKLLEDLMSETPVLRNEATESREFFFSIWTNIWSIIEKKRDQLKNKTINLKKLLTLAASIIGGLIIGILVNLHRIDSTEPMYYIAHAPKGSVSEVVLPDGSTIILNADSKIRYNIDGKDGIREVYLEGEAWFDVEKNKEKPFLVHTPLYDVQVTGTQFNVKAYGSDNLLTTTLEEGQITLQSTDNFRLAKDIIIKPGEQATLNKDSRELTVKEVNPKWYTSWKDNKLIFVNMNLKDLEVLLERKYGVNIDIKDKDLLDLHFDGTIKNESILEFLEIIQKTLPINYRINGQQIEITSNN